jgi:protein-S-isoprenylcysteine O-methyltransferase Ste14
MKPEFGNRVATTALATICNFLFFIAVIVHLKDWGEILFDGTTATFLVIVSAFCVVESWLSSKRVEVIVCSRSNLLDVVLAQLTGAALLLILVFSLAEHLVVPPRIGVNLLPIGIVLAGSGIFLRASAIRTLGNSFVSLPRVTTGQKLVGDGPYRFMRHPSETGLVCICLGTAWTMHSIAGTVLTLGFLLPISFLRTRREETILSIGFDQKYSEYQAQVGGIMPFLRRS